MADVVTKAITANPIKNNTVTLYVTQGGVAQSFQTGQNKVPSLQAVEDRLTGRYDYQVK